MLRGLIKPDGTIYSGSGFTSRKISTGLYEITFSTRFADHPAVIATQDFPNTVNSSGGDTRDNAVVVDISQRKCRIKCGGGSGSASDRYFSFLAIGLR
ncbi:hypothetical protein NIES208_07040 [[Limnothrix rosea] IAM M-220]|nr:hypothetical protein NIES208_07040 [[Limnothrix rosea] IAM M-220]